MAASFLGHAFANSFEHLLTSGNGNYILQLNHTTCIKHFVPRFIEGAFQIFNHSSHPHWHLFEKSSTRISRRDTGDDQVHVFDAYDFGSSFKAISVHFNHLNIVQNLLTSFTDDIIKFIPDEDIEFDLSSTSGKTSMRSKRVESNHRRKRIGNFDFDSFEHDTNCPFKHPNDEHTSSQLGYAHSNKVLDSISNNSALIIKNQSSKKTSTRKAPTSKTSKNKTNSKKKSTTKKGPVKKMSSNSKKKPASSKKVYLKQTKAQWNLARISERKRSLSKPYIYTDGAGSGTYVYVIDDGLNTGHVEFGGRAKWGWSAYSDTSKLGEGHGTHVAGIIGSKTYGVAKKANLIAVQVLNDEGVGSVSSLLAGLQWVTKDVKTHALKGKAIINMSLGVRKSETSNTAIKALNSAITAVVDDGVPLIAAAGNWNSDACDVLPASNPNVFAVAASDKNDKMASYSCWGKCVQLLAPGDNIKSTFIKSKTSTTTMSGTSMAAPHVAGVAALLIKSLDNPTPANLYKELVKDATRQIVSSVRRSTPNLLLYNGQELTST
ncbi:peptidase S8/S53 domain-containing protein [Mycotypha africana]|uniref:peptidase S8/S53 domain-containing protein n=1 Tax=Mycotypha africana TaxID=64632 RepID=UPI0023001DCD|nr:peptidase S8/S53 domain-containing protein [Mycotypha africana]KAI8969079.1 peptidase S8/S53 domain-containing protein [Mycotypha africana]